MEREDESGLRALRGYRALCGVVGLACIALVIYVLRSGALMMWDRYSPSTDGPVLPWPLALLIGVPAGVLLTPLVLFQLELLYDRLRGGD